MRIKMYIYFAEEGLSLGGGFLSAGVLCTSAARDAVRLRGADSEPDNWLWLGASNQSRCVTVKISPCTRVTACRPSRRALSAGHYLQFLLFNWGPARANASSRGDAQPAAHNYNAEEIIFSAPPQPVAPPLQTCPTIRHRSPRCLAEQIPGLPWVWG